MEILQDRNFNCMKPTLRLLIIFIILGSFRSLYHSSISKVELPSMASWPSSSSDTDPRESIMTDSRYMSSLRVEWDHVSTVIKKMSDTNGFRGIGLLNFDENEVNDWKEFMQSTKLVVLELENAPRNITWESLFPEWIDEEEESEVPTCPSLPQIQVPGNPRVDLIAVKLPCNRSQTWSRDVARLHLQLEAARLAASRKTCNRVHVLVLSECFPLPNLFSCKELVAREGNAWLYKPDKTRLRETVRLPVGSCRLSLPRDPEGTLVPSRTRREAYATILHSAHIYVCGAIAVAQSIRATGSTRDLVILVDETISRHHREGLQAAGWKVVTIQRIRNPRAKRNAYNEWNYSKFRLWQLTDYDKVIFIDSDLLVLRNIDFLFEMPEISATGNNATLFNSGVMVIEPSNCTFQLLMDHINEITSYNGGDQGYLNEVFTWWHRIPKNMNFLKHFWEGDSEEYKKKKTFLFGADPPLLHVLHYLGRKPWLCFRDYDCNWNVGHYRKFASDVAHKTWWRVYDSMPGNLKKFCNLSSKQKAGLEWDRRQAERKRFEDGHWNIQIKDKRLKTCSEKFCSWESMLLHWGQKN